MLLLLPTKRILYQAFLLEEQNQISLPSVIPRDSKEFTEQRMLASLAGRKSGGPWFQNLEPYTLPPPIESGVKHTIVWVSVYFA